MTVKNLTNDYRTHQAAKMDARDTSVRHFEDGRRILRNFAKAVGKQRVVSDLRPQDFAAYRTHLAKRLGVHALTRTITVIKGAFKYAAESGLIESLPLYAHAFRKPSAAQFRKAKQKAELTDGKKTLADDQRTSGADGMTMDTQGRSYLTTRIGLQVFDQLDRVHLILDKLQNAWLSNVVFAGPQRDTPFVTCGDKVFRRKINAKGVVPSRAPVEPPRPGL